MSIKTVDLYWAAGFLDGEGTFGINGAGNTPTIAAGQKYTPSLERLACIFGHGAVYYKGYKRNKEGHWMWQINGRRAAAIMMTLYPLLSLYRQGQIAGALREWKRRAAPRRPYIHQGEQIWPF